MRRRKFERLTNSRKPKLSKIQCELQTIFNEFVFWFVGFYVTWDRNSTHKRTIKEKTPYLLIPHWKRKVTSAETPPMLWTNFFMSKINLEGGSRMILFALKSPECPPRQNSSASRIALLPGNESSIPSFHLNTRTIASEKNCNMWWNGNSVISKKALEIRQDYLLQNPSIFLTYWWTASFSREFHSR